MQDYKKLYFHLFNAYTNAVEAIGRQDYGAARDALIRAQQDAEEMYVAEEET